MKGRIISGLQMMLIAYLFIIHHIYFVSAITKNMIDSPGPKLLKQFSKPKAFSLKTMSYEANIDAGHSIAKFGHFWKSTGLCPPDPHQEAYKFLTSKDIYLDIALISALPKNGITHMRIHWLLDLVGIRVDAKGKRTYNYTYLDQLVDKLFQYDIGIGFELMGNPSELFTDFQNATQIWWWRDFVMDLAKHYIYLYGENYVASWRFETWNEPDHHDFDGLKFTTQGFLNYYDACSEGLLSASKELKFGGPGGSCHTTPPTLSPICWALLDHCVSGKNYFTGTKGNRIDFISFHKKGNGTSKKILLDELSTMMYIEDHLPELTKVPFYNDEADPLKNWALPIWWRADVTYAAIVAKIVVQHIWAYFAHQKSIYSNYMLGLLSNDNAFLSYHPNQFTQRTLLARFQINNTNPNYVQYVRKPVYSVMGLLSQLCDELVKVKIHPRTASSKFSADTFGGVATVCHSEKVFRMSVLLYNSGDTNRSSTIAHVNLFLKNLPIDTESAMKWALFKMSNKLTNPYFIWKSMGSPPFPTFSQFSAIKNHEEPFLEQMGTLNASTLNLSIAIPRPGIAFFSICARAATPHRVTDVKILVISKNNIQMTWKDNKNKCVLFYNIEHGITFHGPFEPLRKKAHFPSFWFSCQENDSNCTVEGFYRIQAVDYWKIRGYFSIPIEV